ncbi:AraC family transcriptional regulator [Pontibacter sp. BT731]|uniref:helix-turn-helix domain-containing protein n=1 Tax=Pontibacter coccineus TaxID=3063328 RepID=UPI0026E2493F|nr:AraC family transcriptional regulator [Pontibacter sp. BT731]MDO6388631.1 AraC family transcriptional regulator [Pontibacter sp. BT731]
MKLYIKYMVSSRCKALVQEELKNLGLQSEYVVVDLGIVEIHKDITDIQLNQLKENLSKSGLELLDDSKSQLIDKIKTLITDMIHASEEQPKVNYSVYISEKLGYNYNYLANIFSEVKGITIQQFIIIHKIEKAKELLFYDELSLTEIAHRLHYSSVAHLSSQFKKVTGLSPTFYKKIKDKREGVLENL